MAMRLRFNLKFMFGAATAIALLIFWVRWPLMTAEAFVRNPQANSAVLLTEMDTLEEQVARIEALGASGKNRNLTLKPFPRTFWDVVGGSQHFSYGAFELTARRGKIGVYGPYFDFGFGPIRR